MPSAVACPKCKTRYSLPDELLGKPVKCKSCSTLFQVNPPKKAVAKTSPLQRSAVANPANTAELARMGLDGPIQGQPDLFGEVPSPQAANPLANHFVADPGFADIEGEVPVEEELNDISAMFENPALAPRRKKKRSADDGGSKKKKRRRKKEGGGEQAWKIVLSINFLALIAMISMGLSLDITTATKAYFFVINPCLGLISFGVTIWWLVRCFECKDSVGQFIMVLLIPFYIFFFSYKSENKPYTEAPMNAWWMMVLGGIALAAAAYFLGINEQFQRLYGQI